MFTKQNNFGFNLIEIIIVVGIFSSTILAIFALVEKNIYVQKHNKDYLVASMLAQEALEMARNVRDKNWLDEVNIPEYYETLIDDDDFIIDYHVGANPGDNIVSSVNDPSADGNFTNIEASRLYINSDGYYDHDNTGTSTKYFRMVKVKDEHTDAQDPHIELTAVVQWKDKGVKREYAASTKLYDWR